MCVTVTKALSFPTVIGSEELLLTQSGWGGDLMVLRRGTCTMRVWEIPDNSCDTGPGNGSDNRDMMSYLTDKDPEYVYELQPGQSLLPDFSAFFKTPPSPTSTPNPDNSTGTGLGLGMSGEESDRSPLSESRRGSFRRSSVSSISSLQSGQSGGSSTDNGESSEGEGESGDEEGDSSTNGGGGYGSDNNSAASSYVSNRTETVGIWGSRSGSVSQLSYGFDDFEQEVKLLCVTIHSVRLDLIGPSGTDTGTGTGVDVDGNIEGVEGIGGSQTQRIDRIEDIPEFTDSSAAAAAAANATNATNAMSTAQTGEGGSYVDEKGDSGPKADPSGGIVLEVVCADVSAKTSVVSAQQQRQVLTAVQMPVSAVQMPVSADTQAQENSNISASATGVAGGVRSEGDLLNASAGEDEVEDDASDDIDYLNFLNDDNECPKLTLARQKSGARLRGETSDRSVSNASKADKDKDKAMYNYPRVYPLTLAQGEERQVEQMLVLTVPVGASQLSLLVHTANSDTNASDNANSNAIGSSGSANKNKKSAASDDAGSCAVPCLAHALLNLESLDLSTHADLGESLSGQSEHDRRTFATPATVASVAKISDIASIASIACSSSGDKPIDNDNDDDDDDDDSDEESKKEDKGKGRGPINTGATGTGTGTNAPIKVKAPVSVSVPVPSHTPKAGVVSIAQLMQRKTCEDGRESPMEGPELGPASSSDTNSTDADSDDDTNTNTNSDSYVWVKCACKGFLVHPSLPEHICFNRSVLCFVYHVLTRTNPT